MANNKRSALEVLYIEYKDHIYNYIYRLCSNPDLAQDVVQQTFLKLMHDPNLGSLSHPKAYLFTIARNTLYDQWKKKREVLLANDDQEETGRMVDDINPSPQEQVQESDLQKKVAGYINSLPEKSRELMVLRYTEDMSVKEISHVTGRSLSDVKVNLHRARLRFDQGFTQHMYAKVAASRDNCRELTALLAPYDDELPADQLPLVEQHLVSCSVCAEDAQEMKRARQLFATLPLIAAPLALDAAFNKAVAAELGTAVGSAVGTTVGGTASGGAAVTSTSAAVGKTLGTKVAAGVLVAALGGGAAYLATKPEIENGSATPTEVAGTNTAVGQAGSVPIRTAARLTANDEKLASGVHWTAHRLDASPDSPATPKWVTSSNSSEPVFKLAPGQYLLTARYGEAQQQKLITVDSDTPQELDFVLGAGFLQTTTRLSPDSQPLDSGVRYTVHEALPDKDGKYKYVTAISTNSGASRLPAGRYRITARTANNAETSQEFEVLAGKRTDVDLVLQSGYLQLGARLTPKGPLLEQGVKFNIYSAEPDSQGKYTYITQTRPNSPAVSLAAGHYRIETSYGRNSKNVVGDLEVKAGERTVHDDIVLGSGFLQLGARLAQGAPLLKSKVKFNVYHAEQKPDGKFDYVTQLYPNSGPVSLAAGHYRVESSFGRNGKHLVEDLEVKAGEKTEYNDIVLNSGFLELGARLAPGGPLLNKDVKFNIYYAKPEVTGKYKYIAQLYHNSGPVSFAANRYRVEAVYGTNGKQTTEVTVTPGKKTTQKNIVLNAGLLKLSAFSKGQKTELKKDVKFNIYSDSTDAAGKRKYLAQTYPGRKPAKLAAGTYYITAIQKDKQVSKQVTVKAGKTVDVKLML